MGLSGQSPAHSKELRLLEESSVWFSLRHETMRLSSGLGVLAGLSLTEVV